MTSLALRGGYNLSRFALPYLRKARYINRAVQGARLAGMVYRNRRPLRRAGRWARSKLGKRRSRSYSRPTKKMRLIGENVGKSTTKKTYVGTGGGLVQFHDSRTLYAESLTTLAKQTGAGEINKRERDIVNMRGIKFCWEIANRTNEPMHFNWAVVTPKVSPGILSVDFFRQYDTARSETFSSGMSSNELSCLPINPDRYIIHTHKRFLMGPANGQVAPAWSTNKSNFMKITRYLPIKRQMAYDTPTAPSGVVNRGIFVVWWCDAFQTPVGQQPTVGAISVSRREIMTFKDPKC